MVSPPAAETMTLLEFPHFDCAQHGCFVIENVFFRCLLYIEFSSTEQLSYNPVM